MVLVVTLSMYELKNHGSCILMFLHWKDKMFLLHALLPSGRVGGEVVHMSRTMRM